MSLQSEDQEWRDSPYPRSTNNQWRCFQCHHLLGLSDAEHKSLHLHRRDEDRYIHDLGGVAIEAPCRHCGRVNWLFSEGVSESTRRRVKGQAEKKAYPYRD